MSGLPPSVLSWIGVPRYDTQSVIPVEQGYVWTFCAAVHDGNPLYWNPETAAEITGANERVKQLLDLYAVPQGKAGRIAKRKPEGTLAHLGRRRVARAGR